VLVLVLVPRPSTSTYTERESATLPATMKQKDHINHV